jgi:hypothetical protein
MSAEMSQASEAASVQSHIEALRKPDDLLTSLRARIDLLEAQQREQHKPPKITAKTLTVLGSIIAAVIPLTTAIDGYLKWRADLAVTAQQQVHSARMDSLKTVLSAQLPELERESRLRLLLAMLEPGDAIHEWAAGELGRVEKTVKLLEDEKSAALREREAWEQKAADAAAKIDAKQGSSLSELLRGTAGVALVPADEFSAALGGKPAPKTPGKVGPQASVQLTPEALEYQQAKRMSDVATDKANARARRLAGSDFY